MRWFSVATIAYQLFFLSYIFGIGDPETDVSAALYVPLLAWAVALRRAAGFRRRQRAPKTLWGADADPRDAPGQRREGK